MVVATLNEHFGVEGVKFGVTRGVFRGPGACPLFGSEKNLILILNATNILIFEQPYTQ